jgi:hypothetical protein
MCPKPPKTRPLDKNEPVAAGDGCAVEASRQETRQEVDRLLAKGAELTTAEKMIDALRPGAVECMAEMIIVLGRLPRDQVRKIVLEIRELGESGGIPLGDLEARYECDHIDGLFSGQQMFCMLHCGMKLINPNVKPLSGLDREYELARQMTGK